MKALRHERFIRRMLWAVLFMSLGTTSAWALQGVIEQTVVMPDGKVLYHGSTEIRLSPDPSGDATAPDRISEFCQMGVGGAYVNWALGSSTVDGQFWGSMTAEVVVVENLGWAEVGNYSAGEGMQSARELSDTLDVDTLKLMFVPHDNPHGEVEVEVVQKTYNTIFMKFASNDSTDQQKYLYVRVVNTLIDGSIQETTFQWSENTTTATAVGVGAEFSLDGEVTGSASWQSSVDQGTDGFQHTVASRIPSVTRLFTIAARGQGDQSVTVPLTVDAGFQWNLNTVDSNWGEAIPDASKLEASAQYFTVIGLGRITITKNTDGTADHCPLTWHAGTDLGNPELATDRPRIPFVTYVHP